jgi:hypothetical protein
VAPGETEVTTPQIPRAYKRVSSAMNPRVSPGAGVETTRREVKRSGVAPPAASDKPAPLGGGAGLGIPPWREGTDTGLGACLALINGAAGFLLRLWTTSPWRAAGLGGLGQNRWRKDLLYSATSLRRGGRLGWGMGVTVSA